MADGTSLITDARRARRVRDAGSDALAARAMSEDQVALYARWLTWLFELDAYAEGQAADADVEELFDRLLGLINTPSVPRTPGRSRRCPHLPPRSTRCWSHCCCLSPSCGGRPRPG